MALLRARPAPLHRLLRRPLLRRGRHLVQVAQGGAGRRHRGPARQRDLLRHLEPPPSAAARHDGERALDRDQSGRGGGGEGVAVRPLRPLARLPQMQPGRVSRHGVRLCRPLRRSAATATRIRAEALEWATTRGARSGRDGLAVHPGSGGTAGDGCWGDQLPPLCGEGEARGRFYPLNCSDAAPDRPGSTLCGSRSAVAARSRCRSGRTWRSLGRASPCRRASRSSSPLWA